MSSRYEGNDTITDRMIWYRDFFVCVIEFLIHLVLSSDSVICSFHRIHTIIIIESIGQATSLIEGECVTTLSVTRKCYRRGAENNEKCRLAGSRKNKGKVKYEG